MDEFEVLTDGSDMPLVTWTTDGRDRHWDLYDLSAKLRERGWQVPAYPMPANIEDITVMRVVFRNGVSMDLTRLLLDDIARRVEVPRGAPGPGPASGVDDHRVPPLTGRPRTDDPVSVGRL